jgi:hypothetical protein
MERCIEEINCLDVGIFLGEMICDYCLDDKQLTRLVISNRDLAVSKSPLVTV